MFRPPEGFAPVRRHTIAVATLSSRTMVSIDFRVTIRTWQQPFGREY
jgi:hypothetical protein